MLIYLPPEAYAHLTVYVSKYIRIYVSTQLNAPTPTPTHLYLDLQLYSHTLLP